MKANPNIPNISKPFVTACITLAIVGEVAVMVTGQTVYWIRDHPEEVDLEILDKTSLMQGDGGENSWRIFEKETARAVLEAALPNLIKEAQKTYPRRNKRVYEMAA